MILVVGGIPLIPAFILTRYFVKSKILDYILFAGVYYLSSVNGILIFLSMADETSLLLIQFIDTTFLLITFLIFLHISRIKWNSINLITIIGTLWYLIMQVMTILYEKSEQCSNVMIYGFQFSGISGPPCGIFSIGSNTIYGSQFLFIAEVYQLIILIYGAVLYSSINELIETDRITNAKKLWILAIGLISIFPIFAMGAMLNLWTWQPMVVILTNLAGFIIIAFIMIYYPEAVIMTKIQLNRLVTIQENHFQQEEEDEDFDVGIDELDYYIGKLKKMNLIRNK